MLRIVLKTVPNHQNQRCNSIEYFVTDLIVMSSTDYKYSSEPATDSLYSYANGEQQTCYFWQLLK